MDPPNWQKGFDDETPPTMDAVDDETESDYCSVCPSPSKEEHWQIHPLLPVLPTMNI